MSTVTLESSLDGVDHGEALVLDAAHRLGFDDDAIHEIAVAVRETLVNAVAHGNRYNAKKRVHLSIAEAPDRLDIEIADEGAGFNSEAVPDPLGGDNLLRQSGRGLLMIRAYMDQVEVSPRQPAGTSVKMVKLRKDT